MIYALFYISLIVVTLCAFSLRAPQHDVRTIAILSIFWPLSWFVTIIYALLWTVKWDLDVSSRRNAKAFEVRRTDDNWPGVAITLFHTEFQIWKKRK
jgi:hypothetical protein